MNKNNTQTKKHNKKCKHKKIRKTMKRGVGGGHNTQKNKNYKQKLLNKNEKYTKTNK